MKTPIRYFGGKGNMINTLVSYFPSARNYDTFVDAYGGSGVVLLNKPRTTMEVYNDLDQNVYSLFVVLRDPDLFHPFYEQCQLAFYDETTSETYEASLRTDELTLLERAFRFWYVSRTRRGGGLGGFMMNLAIRRRMSKSVSDFLSAMDGLPALHARLSPVIVRRMDALKLIQELDFKRTLMYLDPPYLHNTRTGARYRVDATQEHHEQLVDTLNQIQHAYIALSGYDNDLYAGLQGFTRYDFTVNTVTGNNERKTKIESLWTNYVPPMMAEDQPETLSMFGEADGV